MAKGHQTPLSVIRKNLIKCPENVKKQAYLTLVRPQLEYVDVAHGIRTFKNRKKKLRVSNKGGALSPQGPPPLGGALSPQGSPPLGGALSPQGSPPLGGTSKKWYICPFLKDFYL